MAIRALSGVVAQLHDLNHACLVPEGRQTEASISGLLASAVESADLNGHFDFGSLLTLVG